MRCCSRAGTARRSSRPGSLALPFVVYLVAVGDPASWVVLAISLFAVVAYSVKGLRFKERPFLDSIT